MSEKDPDQVVSLPKEEIQKQKETMAQLWKNMVEIWSVMRPEFSQGYLHSPHEIVPSLHRRHRRIRESGAELRFALCSL